MPDIDPSSFHSADPPQSLNPSSLTLTKPNAAANGAAAAQKVAKAEKDKGQQRIDLEPIYSQLKANIGEQWIEYRDTINQFCNGMLMVVGINLRIHSILEMC